MNAIRERDKVSIRKKTSRRLKNVLRSELVVLTGQIWTTSVTFGADWCAFLVSSLPTENLI